MRARDQQTLSDLALIAELFPDAEAEDVHRKYVDQKRNAIKRGIPWEFTVTSWVVLWRDSGKWLERRRGGYVMTRPGDAGPYSPANVRIATQSENTSEAWITSPAGTRRKHQPRPDGAGRWRYDNRYTPGPYHAELDGTYIGSFSTEAEADAAHMRALQAQPA